MDITQDDTGRRLQKLLRPHLKFISASEPLTADSHLGALGLDSMAAINLLFDLEQEFEIQITDEAISENTFTTLTHLYALVDRLRAHELSH